MSGDLFAAAFGELAQQFTLGIVEFRWDGNDDSCT
jgi:hypothetical protein